MKQRQYQQWRLSECCEGGCGSEERVFLFNVRHRGSYRRLCTGCVLKNHPASFCPICFDVYDDHHPPPPPHQRLMCLNCPSISHLSCANSNSNSNAPPPYQYQCPPCSDPTFSFFGRQFSSSSATNNNVFKNHKFQGQRFLEIDKDLAKQLLAAARISLQSMNKAAVVARFEAETRVKEAALARKRAKDALDRLHFLISICDRPPKNRHRHPPPSLDSSSTKFHYHARAAHHKVLT